MESNSKKNVKKTEVRGKVKERVKDLEECFITSHHLRLLVL